jgi:hypothetical protein
MVLSLLKKGEDGKIIETGIRRFPEGELENCVFCGNQTDVRCNTPLNERKFYIPLVGQTCPPCYGEADLSKIYGTNLPIKIVGGIPMIVLYQPTLIEILRKRGFRDFIANLFKGF